VIGRTTDAAHKAYTLYRKSGHPNHLHSAIQGFQVVLDQCPDGHPHRAAALSNLAHAILYGFTKELRTDIDHAISLFRSALVLRPREHPDHILSILNLCQALHHRHLHRKSGADLREAAEHYRSLLPLCVEGSHLQLCAIEQCNALHMDPSDTSIALRRTVLEHCSPRHQHRARSLSRLAEDLHARFIQSGNIDHIHEAVDLSREALAVCPADGQRSFFLNVLFYYTFEWLRHRGYSRDIGKCITQNQNIIPYLNQTGAKGFPGAFGYANTVDSSLWKGQCSDFKSTQFPGKAACGGTGQPRTNWFCVGFAARSYKYTSSSGKIVLSYHLRRLWGHLAM
jgi:hypothetical protein